MKSGLQITGAVCLTTLMCVAQSATPVADAAMQGDTDVVRSLLRDGADVNASQGDGMTALHWAAYRDNVEMAKILIYAGANPNALTRVGDYSPLILASRNGYPEMIAALIKAGADVNASTAEGASPIHLAAAAGNAEAVSVLLDSGADVNGLEAVWGQTPLMFAASNNRTEAMATLIARGADLALATKVVTVPELQAEASQERRIRNAVRDAIENAGFNSNQGGGRGGRGQRGGGGRGQRGQAAQGRGGRGGRGQQGGQAAGQADPGAAAQGRRGRGQRGGQAQADPGAAAQGRRGRGQRGQGDPAQGDPAAQGRGGRGQRGGGGRGGGQDPADPADELQGNQGQAVRQVSGGGRSSNIGGLGGNTALHHAARQGHVEAAMLLLDAGADINQAHGGDKSTALMIATINGHFDLAMKLLERGADPNLANIVGATPLYGCINVRWAPTAFYPQPSTRQEQTTHLELMKALLDAGADPNARLTDKVWYTGYNFDQSGENETGATAFWRAAQSGDVEAMRLLVRNGADPNLSNTVTRAARGGGRGGRGRGRGGQSAVSTVPDEVETAARDALEQRREALGDQHPATLASMFDLGVLLQKAGKLEEAEPRLREALDGRREVLGEDHPSTLTSMVGLGSLLAAQRKGADAVTVYQQALEVRSRIFGDDDPNAQALVDAIAAAEQLPQQAAQTGTRTISQASADELRGEDPPAEEPEEAPIPDLGPPVPQGGPAMSALHMAAGAGFDGNFHVTAPYGRLRAVQFLVEELGFDVNSRDYRGYTPMHHAAFRGDNEMILYLVAQGGDPKAVARSGQTTVDMANGPIQRLQPFEDTIALLEGMGAVNNHKAVSR